MRPLFLFTVLFVMILIGTVNAQTMFFQALPDIPVAEGIQPLPDQETVFDKPAGRFAQVVALLNHPEEKNNILSYYHQSLPAFGWSAQSDTLYKRGNETLKLWFEDFGGETYLYISVEP
tara:strand:+ start:48662 stop:49018 length:357 start_codon:yes stop_codon:yes gene_type:complete